MTGVSLLNYLASAAENPEASAGFLESLGIDWTLLVLQAIAFLILVWALGKFVYPIFLRVIDEREGKIAESLEAAREAEKNASSSQEKIDQQLSEARREARDIIATAKDEATAMLAKADEKAKSNAEHFIATARDEVKKETIAAKKALHNETIELVALATEKVISSSHSAKADTALIKKSLEEAKK